MGLILINIFKVAYDFWKQTETTRTCGYTYKHSFYPCSVLKVEVSNHCASLATARLKASRISFKSEIIAIVHRPTMFTIPAHISMQCTITKDKKMRGDWSNFWTDKYKADAELLKNLNPRKATSLAVSFSWYKRLLPPPPCSSPSLYTQAKFPGSGSMPWFSPYLKKGDHRDCSQAANYLPISLTSSSICCKLLEHLVRTEITRHLDQHIIIFLNRCATWIPQWQSCEKQLILLQKWTKDIKWTPYSLISQKPFVKVPHQRLFLKLASMAAW